MSMSREEALFRSFKHHSTRESLTELLRGYQDHVYNICYQVLRHPEDAEDVSQEVLLEVSRGLVKAESSRQFKVWVYRVALHSSLDLTRARERRIELARRSAELRSKEVVLVKPDERAALMEAIGTLDDKTQCLLMEHYFDKLTLDEIGQREGISSVAVWKRLDRAKGLLRWALIAAGFSATPAGIAHGLESISPAAASEDLI